MKQFPKVKKQLPRLVAGLFGVATWHIASQWVPIRRSYTVPVALYNEHDQKLSLSPERVTVTLCGPRKTVRSAASELALHIDASKLEGPQMLVPVTADGLLLAPSVQLVSSSAAYVRVATQG